MNYSTATIVLFSLVLLVSCDSKKHTKTAEPPLPTPSSLSASPAIPAAPLSFNRDIRPILSENCWGCHGADLHEAEADYSLVNLQQAQKKVRSGLPGITPGDPEQSEAWLRILDSEDPMPPLDSHKKLSSSQKALLKRWIAEGAHYEAHWAYLTPKEPRPVHTSQSGWNTHWIDQYLAHTHASKGFTSAPETDAVTFIRRLHFDLAGLPPSTTLVDRYLAAPDAKQRSEIIDELLASPAFGERLAVYWFDLARFADTVGYHGDQGHRAGTYRDWVIYAFNQNLPFNQFITWQLAGDLVTGLSADEKNDALVASCYNRLNQSTHEGGAQAKEYATVYDADRVRGVSGAFFGATIGCAQCHDHKFDPFSQKDFYSLAAFFADLGDLEHLSKGKHKGKNGIFTNRHPERLLWSPLERQRKKELTKQLSQTSDRAVQEKLRGQIQSLKPRLTMVSQSIEPRSVKILHRGDWQDESGETVQPAVPAFMGDLSKSFKLTQRATRLDLARWLTTPKTQGGCAELTARVFVNRLWYLFFGEGLCPSLDDFGGQGEYPNHPELLDKLALDFATDWNTKRLIKMMVSTRAYRMSSIPTQQQLDRDPLNHQFSRQGSYRLAAEFIRDNALAISGLLVNERGGESAKPYQPKHYYQHLNFPTRTYQESKDRGQWKRGVYVHWQRQFLHPMMKAFDAPSREECSAKRPRSNTPTAALTLLNDPTFIEAARAFAEKALKQAQLKTDQERLTWMFRRALSRQPSTQEQRTLTTLLQHSRASFQQAPQQAEALLGQGLAPRDTKLSPVEHAAWTQLARALLNLHETITRN